MTTPQIISHNVITGETITRDFNADELAQLETDKEQTLKNVAKKAKTDTAKAAARQAVIDKLGLNADEIAALLG